MPDTTTVEKTADQTTESTTQVVGKTDTTEVTGDPSKVTTDTTKTAETQTTQTTETKPEDANLDPAKEPVVEYMTYNDPAADAIVGLFKEAGVKPTDATAIFKKAVETGNFKDIDYKGLVDKVGTDRANLIMIGAEAFYSKQVKARDESAKVIYETAGSKEAFDTLKGWALDKEKADPKFKGELDEYRKMINTSPVQAKLAVESLLKAYKADPKTKSLSIKMTEADKSGSTGSDLKYISRADYINELKVANKKGDQREIGNLNARRIASMQQEKNK